MKSSENPRAFPSTAIADDFGGMTLRDHFAGQALAGMSTWAPCPPEGFAMGAQDQGSVQKLKAVWAYQMADAMLEARKSKAEQ